MSEKRFYYNTFYHADDMDRVLEYEIIDRKSYPNYPNHDERNDLPGWYMYIGENDSGWQDMLVDLLNEQDEYITILEQQLGCFDGSCYESYKTNKELRDCLEKEIMKNSNLQNEINRLRIANMRLKELEE